VAADRPSNHHPCRTGRRRLSFAVSLGEFGATLFIVRPDAPTLPIAIYRLLGQPGTLVFGQAMAMATLLMLVTALAVLVIDRFRLTSASLL
jgi:thiamine transport system permease protein